MLMKSPQMDTFGQKRLKCNVIYNKRLKNLTVIDFGLVKDIFQSFVNHKITKI